MLLYNRNINFFFISFICIILTRCGGNGCKYPDEILAGGIWTDTQTTIVRPINRNVIQTETANGEYTLKPGTTDSLALSNLWVPLRNTDGTYATVQAGKKIKITASGSVLLAGYQYNTSLTFQDWVSMSNSGYSFAPVKYSQYKAENDSIVKIEKNKIFNQNGTTTLKTTYFDTKGNDKVDSGEIIASAGCNVATEYDDIAVNYAFLYPAKIVFTKGFFILYTKDDNTGIINSYSDDTCDGNGNNTTITINGDDIRAYVEYSGGKYYYKYDFTYLGNDYTYSRLIKPTMITYDGILVPNFEEKLSANNYTVNPDKPYSGILSCVGCDEVKVLLSNGCYDENGKKYNDYNDKTLCENAGLTWRKFSLKDLDDKFKVHKDLTFSNTSPVMIYFKKYNDVGYTSNFQNYYGDNYIKYFYAPVYGEKNNIPISSISTVYKNRFSSLIQNTGSSSADVINYPTNCRMFPKKIKYKPKKIMNNYSKITSTNVNTNDFVVKVKQSDCSTKQVGLLEYCNRYCIDICNSYFTSSNTENRTYNKVAVGFDPKNFFRYSIVDAKGTDFNSEVKATDCSCCQYSHTIEEIDNSFTTQDDLKKIITDECKNNGETWGGVYAQYYSDNNFIMRKNIPSINSNKFTIIKHVYGTNNCSGSNPSSGTNSIAFGICTPFDKAKGNCDSNDICKSSIPDCQKMGWFYTDKSEEANSLDDNCPVVCKILNSFTDEGYSTVEVETSDFDVVSQIDYRSWKNDSVRKSSNIEDQDNSIYYRVNNGNDVVISGYENIQDGLIAVGGPDVYGIECVDAKIPILIDENLYSENFTYEDGKDFNNCSVSGNYKSISNIGSNDSHLYFTEQKEGLLPIKWSTFTVRPDDILALTIKASGDGTLPPLVKTKNCLSINDNSCYQPLIGGNGLIILLQPDTDDNKLVNENIYKTPNKWMCSYGLGGSYASYQPYKKNRHNLTMANIPAFGTNPRQIDTTFNLDWYCDKNVNIWFTGYDYKNIKLLTSEGNDIDDVSIYPSPHIYKISDLNYFMPDYQPSANKNEDFTITQMDITDCSDDGVPTSIRLSDGTIINKNDNSISVSKVGDRYRYEYYGNDTYVKQFVYDDDALINQIYPESMPERLYVNIPNKENKIEQRLITNEINGLKRDRCSPTASNYCYSFFIKLTDLTNKYDLNECSCYTSNDVITSDIEECIYRKCYYNISVHDERIAGAYCKGDNSDPDIDITNSVIVKKISYNDCGEHCIANGDYSEIYTPYGPFSGFQNDNYNGVMPMIYQPYHMCRGTDKEFIFDEQEANDVAINVNVAIKELVGLGNYDLTGMKRKNVSKFWRVEFTNPTLENKEDYTGIKNDIADVSCSTTDVPDAMFFDLTKTNEWLPENGSYPQTVLIYRNQNALTKTISKYYLVTYNPWGWNDEKISQYDIRIAENGISCGGLQCNIGETPDIEITNNGETIQLINYDKEKNTGNAVIKPFSESVYSFVYNGNTYTINSMVAAESTRVCNLSSNLKSWVSYLATASHSNNGTIQMANLGRAPFTISCGKEYNEGKSKVSDAYKYPYSRMVSITNNNYSISDNENKEIFAGLGTGDRVLVLTTNNLAVLSSKHFAHCTTNWNTNGWMLLNNSADLSSFSIEDTGISGSFVSKQNTNLSWSDIAKKYNIERLWAKYGGIITNTIYEQSGCTKRNLLDNNGDACTTCGTIYTDCNIREVETKYPEFRTMFGKQIIAVKTLASDPLNTTDTDCEINIQGTNHSGKYSLKSNEPFGNVLPSSLIKDMNFSKEIVENDKIDSSISNYETVNGNAGYRNNFFKKSEFYRNLIGAGVVTANWHIIKDDNGKAVLFDKDELINITPSNNSFYAMGNLSHTGSTHCLKQDLKGWVATAFSASYLAVTTGLSGLVVIFLMHDPASIAAKSILVSSIIAGLGGLSADLAVIRSKEDKDKGAMTPISYNTLGSNEPSKRQCGVGIGFRVIELPSFLCKNGFNLTCTNKRINLKYQNSNDKLVENCIGYADVNWQTKQIPIGRCYRQKYNQKTYTSNGEEETLKYVGERYLMNSFEKVPDENKDDWSEIENIYKEQCGLCLPKDKISIYHGISYISSNIPSMPQSIRSSSQCNNYKDFQGNAYTWVTDVATITPFENYTVSEQNQIYDDLNLIFTSNLKACTSEANNNYEIPFTNEDIKEQFINIFTKASSRNEVSCNALLKTLYYNAIASSGASESCIKILEDNLTNMSTKGCEKLLSYVQDKDGEDYYRYIFTKNSTYTVCLDNKSNVDITDDYYSITRVGGSESLKKYGYGELTDNTNIILESGTSEYVDSTGAHQKIDITEGQQINVHIPTTIAGKSFDKANVGFALAGTKNDDPMKLYSNYRLKSANDLKRGYDITIGNGVVSRKGRYLYFYIQENDANGNPNVHFEPNTHFNILSPNSQGFKYKPEDIIHANNVYHFYDYDTDHDGTITFTAPRSGKLWFAVLDVDEKDENNVSISGDRDGKGIIFASEFDNVVNENNDNVLGTNAGFYKVSAKIQGEDFDIVDNILTTHAGDEKVSHTFFTQMIIRPLKTILFGIEKGGDYNWSEWLEDNVGIGSNLLGSILYYVLHFSIVQLLYYILVVISAFVFGGKVLLGMQKTDFKTIFKMVLRYGLVVTALNPNVLSLYYALFVKSAFSISEGLTIMVAGNFTDRVYTLNDEISALDVAFGPVTDILQFWLKIERVEQLLAIACSSWFGWISAILLIVCFVHFLIAVLEALVVYMITLMLLLFQLALGPLYFLFLLFQGTASKVFGWMKEIGGIIAQQVTLFTFLAVFATIYYHIIKGALNFTYCWEPVLTIPIIDVTLFSCWRISGTLPIHMAELMGEYAPTGSASVSNNGFSILTGLFLFMITSIMSKFIDKSANFGASILGVQSNQIVSSITALAARGKSFVDSGITGKMKSLAKKQINQPFSQLKQPINQLRGK